MDIRLSVTDPQVVFAALAALIFLGFLGSLVFSRLRFNDTLLLIAVGVLLGPLLGVIDPGALQAVSAIVGPLALILILFDGGLALRIRDLLQGLSGAAMLGLVGFTLTTGIVGVVVAFTLVDPALTTLQRLLTGFILGAILGGTSAVVVMPTLRNLRTSRRTATVLSLESALTDIMVVVGSFTLIQVVAAHTGVLDAGAAPALDAQGITSALVIVFAMSLFLGALGGFLWMMVLPGVQDKPFGYMLTLGAMFGVYVLVEWILQGVSTGGGPLAVLAFGIVLGNQSALGRIGARVGDTFAPGIKRFQGEISFLVRTFFFIYLGILVDLALFRSALTWAVGVLVFAAVCVARYVAVAATQKRWVLQGDGMVMWVMMPRGLAAAVMAAVPAQMGLQGTEHFVAIAFLILVLSNLMTTVGAMVLERSGASAGPPGGASKSAKATGSGTPAARGGASGKGSASKGGKGGRGGKSSTSPRRPPSPVGAPTPTTTPPRSGPSAVPQGTLPAPPRRGATR